MEQGTGVEPVKKTSNTLQNQQKLFTFGFLFGIFVEAEHLLDVLVYVLG